MRAALGAVGMDGAGGRPPHHLSFGQRRRVALATVLAMDPQILVLDEPTSNLDPAARRDLADILVVAGDGHHRDPRPALRPGAALRSVILNDGVIVADGPTAEILGDAELMAANRLELPFGFDPSRT